MAKRWSRAGALVLALGLLASLSQAQQGPPGKSPGAKEAPAGAELSLQRRVEQLEEQFVDLQVIVGTLESLARGGIAPPPPDPRGGPASGADAGRLDAIETQIRALASQMENLQEQIRSLAARADGAGPPPRFGSVKVAPEAAKEKDEIDKLISQPPGGGKVAAVPPPSEPEVPPQQLYEQAYGYLLQKEYGQAEAGFDDFLRQHPSHQLAGNAQYWLGETFYVRGQYRAAAGAFLKGYQNYANGPKAPESLLKLGMSLQRLGQKDAACSSFNELQTRFPSPPAHVKTLAQAERRRSGC